MTAVTDQNVSTSAVLLVSGLPASAGDNASQSTFMLKNLTATDTVYLGPDATVTTANGFPWTYSTDGPLTIALVPGEQLWAVVATTTQDVRSLKVGR